MPDKRNRARDLAEQGLDKVVEGDRQKGRQLIEEAKKLDPKAVDEIAEEVERERDQAENFIGRK